MSSFDFMKKIVIFVLLASIISSCNLYQNHALKQMKQLTSAGMTQYIEVLPNKSMKSVSVTNTIDPKKKNLLLIHGYQGSSYAQWSANVEEADAVKFQQRYPIKISHPCSTGHSILQILVKMSYR